MPEPKSLLSRLISELKRRSVFHVGVVYLVAAWVVVQVTAITSRPLRLPDWSLAFVIVIALAGFPLALVIAWAFEITPEGVRRTRETGDQEGLRALGRASRLALVGLTAILVGGLAWAAWDGWLRAPRAATAADAGAPLDPNHVAVLYLNDFSRDHDLGYLANGLTETLIHKLSGVGGLTVVPTNGVKQYRGEDSPPIDSIGRLLNAGSVVEGSVQGAGDRVRVNVQLVNASTGDQVASQLVEASLGDPFALQDTVSSEVARFLRVRLGRAIRLQSARDSAHDPRAWKLYEVAIGLRDDANSLRSARDTAGAMDHYRRADSLFDIAGELDPKWTEPVLESGWTHLTMARIQAAVPSQSDTALLREGLRDADRILSDRPGNAPALELKGNLEWFLSQASSGAEKAKTLDAAERDLRAATMRDPSLARAWAVLAYILRGRGSFEEAGVDAQRMREADPYLSNDVQYLYISAILALEFHHIERADSLFARGEELYPTEPAFVSNRLVIVASRPSRRGSVDTAWARLRKTRTLLPPGQKYQEGPFLVAATLARAGLVDSARAVERRARDIDPNSATADYDGAYVALQLGERDRAIDLLERYVSKIPQQRRYVGRDWWWAPLHDDPRFQEIVDTTRSVVR